jgi:GT2 family glycosyltransferase
MMSAHNLPLSILIASYRAETTIAACLESLRDQTSAEAREIIVVDSSPTAATARVVAERFPEVRLVRYQKRKFAGDARNVGISLAVGEIIAFIDADCTAAPDWIGCVLRAHRQLPALAIGGAIDNGNPGSVVGWAAYFAEFSRWLPGTPPQWMADVAGANMSYKRHAFDEFGSFWSGTYCADSEFHWRLARAGHLVRFEPAVRVAHRNIDHLLNALAHEYLHGRSFARVRVAAQRFSVPQRVLYAACFGLIAVRLLLRILAWNVENPVYLGRLLATLPLLVVVLLAWSLGECAGYLRGGPELAPPGATWNA